VAVFITGTLSRIIQSKNVKQTGRSVLLCLTKAGVFNYDFASYTLKKVLYWSTAASTKTGRHLKRTQNIIVLQKIENR